MNPMYPMQTAWSVLHSMIMLLLGVGMLIFLCLVVRKIVPSKAVRRLWEGLDLYAARTGYNRGARDAEVHIEQRDALAHLVDRVAEVAGQLDVLCRNVANAAVADSGHAERPRRGRAARVPRRPSRRRLIPHLHSIPFASTQKLGLARPVPRR